MPQNNKISLAETTNMVYIKSERSLTLTQSKIDHIKSLLRRIKERESYTSFGSHILNAMFFFASSAISFGLAIFSYGGQNLILIGLIVSIIVFLLLCIFKCICNKIDKTTSSNVDELQVIFEKLEDV